MENVKLMLQEKTYYSLKEFAKTGFNIQKLPLSLRIILESLLRNYDDSIITSTHIQNLANWQPNAKRDTEIPFKVARVLLQDFTGVPLLCDLASMRSFAEKHNKDPNLIEPLIPVDLVIDHSVQIDNYGTSESLAENMELEFQRNYERYQFIKWGMSAFNNINVVPPGRGIVHQINLEKLFQGIRTDTQNIYFDTLVGTDSHTTMINGLGVVAWGVGGIEAEAAMLGQPVYLLTPDVVGVELSNKLKEGVTSTDMVLYITEKLRKAKVVGKFVEFYGDGIQYLSATDRTTVANMAPEYGATMGFFPIDDRTIEYMINTGKDLDKIELFKGYCILQGLFGVQNNIEYSEYIKIDLSDVQPCVAGPKRPQDKINLSELKQTFQNTLSADIADNGFGKPNQIDKTFIGNTCKIKHGDVIIAAISSCTNTSNPSVMIAAGLLAKKAIENGLSVAKHIKTSIAPGSRVVASYLQNSGLQTYLEQLGFFIAGYGCTTCIGNSGDIAPELKKTIVDNDIIVATVLSGNRNFEARIHQNIKANFLASPPLVVAFAIAGTVNIDFLSEPLGFNNDKLVFLKDIWPSSQEISEYIHYTSNRDVFQRSYSEPHDKNWTDISVTNSTVYDWPKSYYIAESPFFNDFVINKPIEVQSICNAKALLILGDSITTDHISPAGSFDENTVAGKYLLENGITEFNGYGSRRGNHEVMMRGTFANTRLKNLLFTDGTVGSFTFYNDIKMNVYNAAMNYLEEKIPVIIVTGEEYGTGSSRDWAAKGSKLLGIKAVIAKSFERIHRSNLVGMSILPLQFMNGDSASSLSLDKDVVYNILIDNTIKEQQIINVEIKYCDGTIKTIETLCRIDSKIETEYYKSGGILQYVLSDLLKDAE